MSEEPFSPRGGRLETSPAFLCKNPGAKLLINETIRAIMSSIRRVRRDVAGAMIEGFLPVVLGRRIWRDCILTLPSE